MTLEGTILYEQFAEARQRAVELTDHYHEIPLNDPSRAEVWDCVVRQTEAARRLLESWLCTEDSDAGHEPNTVEPKSVYTHTAGR